MSTTAKNRSDIKNKLWDISLPLPNPNKYIGLSIISVSKDPITNANLFIFCFFTIGISKRSRGNAM